MAAPAIISLGLRLLLSLAFLYAGVVKVWNFSAGTWATPEFFQDILNYQLLPAVHARWPWDLAVVMATYLPWLEIAAAVGVLVPRFRRGGLLILGVLLVVFTAAMASAWMRGLDISCGCFGHEVEKGDWAVPLGRDLVLLAAVALAAWLECRRPTPAL